MYENSQNIRSPWIIGKLPQKLTNTIAVKVTRNISISEAEQNMTAHDFSYLSTILAVSKIMNRGSLAHFEPFSV